MTGEPDDFWADWWPRARATGRFTLAGSGLEADELPAYAAPLVDLCRHAGALLVDGGWLRLLAAGTTRLPGIAAVNGAVAGEPNAPVASGANEGAIPPGDVGQNGEAEGELSVSHETFEPAGEAPAAEASSAGPEPGSQPIAEAVHFKLVDRVAVRRAEVAQESRRRRVAAAAVAALTGLLP